MKKRIVSTAQIAAFKALLVSEEKSAATTEKYIRDVKAFAEYMQNNEITKESVLAYKKHIQQNYAVRSVNSMIASINGFFSFLCWYDLKVKVPKIKRPRFAVCVFYMRERIHSLFRHLAYIRHTLLRRGCDFL